MNAYYLDIMQGFFISSMILIVFYILLKSLIFTI